MVIQKDFLSFFVGAELQLLIEEARISRSKAFTEGTFKNLNCQWVKYLKFCVYFKLEPLPASAGILAWYAQYLSKKFRSHASIVGYPAGVKKLHEVTNYSTQGFRGYIFKLTLLGIRRRNQYTVTRAQLITPSLLQHVYVQLNHNCAEDVVFWCICIMAFFLLFRKSNLVPDTIQGFVPGKQL